MYLLLRRHLATGAGESLRVKPNSKKLGNSSALRWIRPLLALESILNSNDETSDSEADSQDTENESSETPDESLVEESEAETQADSDNSWSALKRVKLTMSSRSCSSE